MNNKKTVLQSLFHALAVIAYIILVVFIMNVINDGVDNEFWTPVLVLIMFVVSAAITGSIVLGRPIYLYLNEQKKEGILFLGYTIGWLFVFMVLAFAIYVLAV